MYFVVTVRQRKYQSRDEKNKLLIPDGLPLDHSDQNEDLQVLQKLCRPPYFQKSASQFLLQSDP